MVRKGNEETSTSQINSIIGSYPTDHQDLQADARLSNPKERAGHSGTGLSVGDWQLIHSRRVARRAHLELGVPVAPAHQPRPRRHHGAAAPARVARVHRRHQRP